MSLKYHLSLLLLAILIVNGCKENTTTTIVSNSVDSLRGELKGNVTLYDSNGNGISNRGGVRVRMDGTNYSTFTDSIGEWTIHNLPTRTYSITYSKDGFDTMKNTSVSFLGGGIIRTDAVSLAQPPNFKISITAASLTFDFYNKKTIASFITYGNTTNDSAKHVRLFYYTSPNFDPYAYSKNAPYQEYLIINKADIQIAVGVSPSSIVNTNDTFYVVVYPESKILYYYDVASDKDIFSGLGKPSNILQVVKP